MEKDLLEEFKKIIKYIRNLENENYDLLEEIHDLQTKKQYNDLYIERLIKQCLIEKKDFDTIFKEIKLEKEKGAF